MKHENIAVQRAIRHGKSRRAELRPHEIPEWTNEGEEIYVGYSRRATLDERNIIWPYVREESLEVYAVTVAVRLLDEHGEPLFSMQELKLLIMGADPDVLIRLTKEINDADTDAGEKKNQEDLEGNSEGTPTDSSSSSSPKPSA